MQFANKAFLEFRDLSLEQAIGKDWVEDMEPNDQMKVKKTMDDAFENKKEFTVQYQVKKGDEVFKLMSKGGPNFSHDGQFVGFIGSCVQLPG